MKNLLYILIALLVLFSSCDNEEDPVFDLSPEKRLNNVLSEYKAKLTEGDGYWIAYYSGSAILMKFNADNTVEFTSTYNDGNDDRKITYRVGASQVPELVFESHTVFHAIYEDNREDAEYEFLFDNIGEEQIDFISKTDLGAKKTKLSFFKGTPEDITKVKAMIDIFKKISFFKKVTIEGSAYEAQIMTFPGEATLRIPLEEGRFQLVDFPYEITKGGLLFPNGLEIDGMTINSFSYDADNNKYQTQVDGKTISITVGGEIPTSEVGVFDAYKSVNMRVVEKTSFGMAPVVTELRKVVPRFSSIQLYSDWGYVLCYAPGTPGGNWAGFSAFSFNENPDVSDQLLIDWGMKAFGAWWQDVYNSDGGKMLLGFLLDPKGLYISKYGLDSYVLVSNTDPSKYILVE